MKWLVKQPLAKREISEKVSHCFTGYIENELKGGRSLLIVGQHSIYMRVQHGEKLLMLEVREAMVVGNVKRVKEIQFMSSVVACMHNAEVASPRLYYKMQLKPMSKQDFGCVVSPHHISCDRFIPLPIVLPFAAPFSVCSRPRLT